MIIRVQNLLDKKAPYSFTSASLAVGGTAIPVKNINQYYPSWGVQLGKTGEEKSEVLVLGTAVPSGTVVNTVGTFRFDHPEDTPVYAIKYDKVIFQRSTVGTAGTATTLTDGTVTITPDSKETIFDDTTGASTYGYRAYFFNSVTSGSSSLSDWLTQSGYTFYSLHEMRERAKNKMFSFNFLQNETLIDDWLNEWLENLNNVAVAVNQDYNLGTVDVAHGTAGLGTITASDFKDITRIWFTTNGNDYYNALKIGMTNFTQQDIFNETSPCFYMFGDKVFGKKPEGSLGTARIVYSRLGTMLSNETDELPTPMKGYTKSFVDYALAQAYYLDSKEKLGDRFMGFANAEKDRFKVQISPRTDTGPSTIELTDPVTGDSFWDLF
jgi:hypothetical protein